MIYFYIGNPSRSYPKSKVAVRVRVVICIYIITLFFGLVTTLFYFLGVGNAKNPQKSVGNGVGLPAFFKNL